MRQIYNTESPPELVMELPGSLMQMSTNDHSIPQPIQHIFKYDEVVAAASNTINNCNIGCKNPSRLSLANLLPSRLESENLI
jgi:hypothetical protein